MRSAELEDMIHVTGLGSRISHRGCHSFTWWNEIDNDRGVLRIRFGRVEFFCDVRFSLPVEEKQASELLSVADDYIIGTESSSDLPPSHVLLRLRLIIAVVARTPATWVDEFSGLHIGDVRRTEATFVPLVLHGPRHMMNRGAMDLGVYLGSRVQLEIARGTRECGFVGLEPCGRGGRRQPQQTFMIQIQK